MEHAKMTHTQLFSFNGTAEDFELNSDNYFAMLSIDKFGFACRDNSLAQLIEFGKSIEQSGEFDSD